jgi:WD40 repeat protein
METRWLRENADAIALSSDGKLIALGTPNGALRILDTETLQLHRIMLGHTHAVTSVAWHPDDNRLASCSKDSTVRVWNLDGKLESLFSGHSGVVNAVAWSPDGRQLVSAGDDNTLRLWRKRETTGTVLATNAKSFKSVAWHPDGHLLACGLRGGHVVLLSSNGDLACTCEGHTDVVDCVAWNPDGTMLASNGWDGTIRLWDTHGRAGPVLQGEPSKKRTTHLSWSADGRRIAAVTGARKALMWRLDGNVDPTLEWESPNIHNLAWLRDGRQLLTNGSHSWLHIRAQDGKVVRQRSYLRHLWRVAWSPDGMWLAGVGSFEGPRLWNNDGRAEKVLMQPTRAARRLAWSPDSKWLATAGWSKDVFVRAIDGSDLRRFALDDDVTSLAWSRSGKHLAAGSVGGAIRIWDVDQQHVISEFQGHSCACNDLAWSADDGLLASGGADGTLRSWHMDGTEGPINGNHSGTFFLDWSRNGQWLASAGEGSPIRFWAADGKAWKPVARRYAAVFLAWSPSGGELAWGVNDSRVMSWKMERGATLLFRAPEKIRSLDWHSSGEWLACSYPAGSSVWNVHRCEWAWHAKIFERGPVSFDDSGDFIDGDPDVIERQFVYVVETADGRQQTLKPSEFAALRETLTDG